MHCISELLVTAFACSHTSLFSFFSFVCSLLVLCYGGVFPVPDLLKQALREKIQKAHLFGRLFRIKPIAPIRLRLLRTYNLEAIRHATIIVNVD